MIGPWIAPDGMDVSFVIFIECIYGTYFRRQYKQWVMPWALSGKSGLAVAGDGGQRAGPSGGPFPADGHTASNTPDLFRPPKLSGAGPG